ncbi:hypothetical protein AARAC_010576 [Aspergillus arachidicola]|uniref:Uncharacterized protein n=1 Tax=Aspergillus arachidicola TaxID=656916 RepID=A0A2G7FX15_9EURO|nr:hypothetical protein AARAC_010576 [Aspergillus arachidicola]
MPRSRFSSGYAKKRAIVLEAIRPKLCSRRILAEDVPSFLEDFSGINPALSTFEREWYSSLLNDRLRRLEALHRIGVTHGDVKDCHFRLPGDMYDTVLYDFSESYTFSPKWPFRVNSGRPRPLRRISEGERKRVRIQVEERANSRDFRSHLINLSSQNIVDGALYQSLDEEKELLELVLLKVYNRPDYFSMPTLNSVFPFLEKSVQSLTRAGVSAEADSCVIMNQSGQFAAIMSTGLHQFSLTVTCSLKRSSYVIVRTIYFA